MIDHTTLPSISTILSALGVPPGRRGRTKCPIHGGGNPQTFAYNDRKGVWYCHRCGIGGDAVRLIELSMDTDFAGALRWLGISPGRPPRPDPERIRRERVREGLRAWAHETARELRYEHYVRIRVEMAARRRLQRNPDDEWGWAWLQWAYTGLDAIAHKLDILEGGEAEQKAAYIHMRRAA